MWLGEHDLLVCQWENDINMSITKWMMKDMNTYDNSKIHHGIFNISNYSIS
jgi:hypothetical protein